jgi:O-antigen ligase
MSAAPSRVRGAAAPAGGPIVIAGLAALLAVAAGFALAPRLGVALLALPLGLLVVAAPAAGVMVLLFVLPLEELGALTPGGMLTVHKLLGVAVAGAWLLQALLRREPVVVPWTAVPLVGFVLWAAASALWAAEADTAVRLTMRLLQLLALYVLVVNVLDRPDRLRHGLYAHVAGGAVLAGLGLVLVAQGVLQGGRAAIVVDRQLLLESNAFAAALLLPVAVCLATALDRARPGPERAVLAAAGALCATTIVLTMSRGALVALAAMAAVVSVARRQVLLPLALVLLALPGLVAVGPALWERLAEGATLADRGAGRLDIWRVGWVVIQHQPVVGVGLGGFPLIYFDYLSQATGISWRHVLGVARTLERYPHNTYLGVTAELGMVGLGLLVATLAVHLRAVVASWRALGARRHPAAPLLLVPIAMLVAVTVLAVGFDVGLRKFLWLSLALAAIGRPGIGTPRAAPAAGPA